MCRLSLAEKMRRDRAVSVDRPITYADVFWTVRKTSSVAYSSVVGMSCNNPIDSRQVVSSPHDQRVGGFVCRRLSWLKHALATLATCCFSESSLSSRTPDCRSTATGLMVSMPLVRLLLDPTSITSVLSALSWSRRAAHQLMTSTEHSQKQWRTLSRNVIRRGTGVQLRIICKWLRMHAMLLDGVTYESRFRCPIGVRNSNGPSTDP